MNDQHLVLLGEIKGEVKSLAAKTDDQTDLIRAMDARVRTLEMKGAVNGAVSGGIVSVGMALIIEAGRQWIGRGGAGHG
jgi:hypothetical protein